VSAYQTIRTARDARGVATVTLARPEVRNAMNGAMWAELRAAFAAIAADPGVRVVVLTGEGGTFCAGGDLRYQAAQHGTGRPERIAQARELALLLQEMDILSKPLVARVNGSCFAGGTAFLAVADVTIGTCDARFAITEARLGMVPGMISQYLVRRLGIAQARRLFLTAREFGASEALQYGLLHRVVSVGELDAAVEEEVALVLRCGPAALATIKQLLAYVHTHSPAESSAYAVERVADMWDSPEAREGIAAFFGKRKPSWAGD
jgi:methylglutaconyl-CoA hydratase